MSSGKQHLLIGLLACLPLIPTLILISITNNTPISGYLIGINNRISDYSLITISTPDDILHIIISALLLTSIAIYGAILPDVDIRTSYAFKVTVLMIATVSATLWLTRILSAEIILAAVLLILMLLMIPHHRGLWHSKWCVIGYAIIIGVLIGWQSAAVGALAVSSHLGADKMRPHR